MVKKFHVRISYEVEGQFNSILFAENETQAREIAMELFKEKHSEICKNPKIIDTREM